MEAGGKEENLAEVQCVHEDVPRPKFSFQEVQCVHEDVPCPKIILPRSKVFP